MPGTRRSPGMFVQRSVRRENTDCVAGRWISPCCSFSMPKSEVSMTGLSSSKWQTRASNSWEQSSPLVAGCPSWRLCGSRDFQFCHCELPGALVRIYPTCRCHLPLLSSYVSLILIFLFHLVLTGSYSSFFDRTAGEASSLLMARCSTNSSRPGQLRYNTK